MDKNTDREGSLYDELSAYGQSDYAAFHMPGHKRQVRAAFLPEGLPWQIDITEIDGFDNLHHAEGILKESMERAASYYGTRRSLYSINGSTAGILSAVFAVTRPGDTILMGRNCHKSVYHAVFLRNLRPLYLYPQIDKNTGIGCGYSPEELQKMLTSHPEIRAVILTSPTYEGVISDIQMISGIVHEKGIPLVIDEAHGAHLTIEKIEKESAVPAWEAKADSFPPSAVSLGADLVIQSLHKTLPALTQTAVLHVCGDLAGADDAARYMSIFQTSSPSYVLMASIDSCIRFLQSDEGKEEQRHFYRRLQKLRSRLRGYEHVHLIEPSSNDRKADGENPETTALETGKSDILDPSKLVLSADGMSGKELYDELRIRYHLQPEMCTAGYTLLMTSMFDTDEMYDRLCRALEQIDEECKEKSRQQNPDQEEAVVPEKKPSQIYIPSQASLMETEEICLRESVGRISAEYAYQYPPGIPLLVPGEEINGEILAHLLKEAEAGLEIQGLRDTSGERIHVICP